MSDERQYYWCVKTTEEGTEIELFDDNEGLAVLHKCSPANGLVVAALEKQIAQLRTDNATLLRALQEALAKI